MKKLAPHSSGYLSGIISANPQHALEVIDSLVDDKRKVATGHWTLSLVKSNVRQHAFLLLEGRLKGEFVIFRTDLFLRQDTDKIFFGQNIQKGSVLDRLFECSASSNGRAFINVRQLSTKDYDEIILNTVFQGWVIDGENAEKLLKRLQIEGQNEHNYHSGGNSSGYSLSDSRSTRTSCVTWCETILLEELGLKLGRTWIPVKLPNSRVLLAQKMARETIQRQLGTAESQSVVSPVDCKSQRQDSRARLTAEERAKYFKPYDNYNNATRSLFNSGLIVSPEMSVVAMAKGKSDNVKNRRFLILETIEQGYYVFRRINLSIRSSLEIILGSDADKTEVNSGSIEAVTKALLQMQGMVDEYTIETSGMLPADSAKLRSKLEQENLRRGSASPTGTSTRLRMFNPPEDIRIFTSSVVDFLQEIGVNLAPSVLDTSWAGYSGSKEALNN
jgi:hypothetical protein